MNIVVVENDLSILRSLEILLSDQGHLVRTFSQPQEALVTLAGDCELELLIVDFSMPQMNGDKFLAELNFLREKDYKVILISGHMECYESLLDRSIEIDSFLPKPIDFNSLCRLIKIFT